MARLFELTKAYVELEALLDDPNINQDEIAEYLDTCTGALQEKVVDIAKLVRNLEATADAIDKAEETMVARRKAIENRVKAIKNYLLTNMQTANIHKIECEFFKIARQKNPPSVVIDDERAVSIAYWRQPETPPPALDRKAILDDMKNGVIVDGAHLEQGERIVIK